jgi:CcmD family protein
MLLHKLFSLIGILFYTNNIMAQTSATNTLNELPETGKGLLYQDGKIYLVVLVLLTIFAGIIFYLTRLDKKLSKLEQDIKN